MPIMEQYKYLQIKILVIQIPIIMMVTIMMINKMMMVTINAVQTVLIMHQSVQDGKIKVYVLRLNGKNS